MTAYPQLEQHFEAALVENEPGTLQRLQILLQGEVRLILNVSLKLGAALLVLEGLAWISALGEPGTPEAVTAAVERPAAAPGVVPVDAAPVTKQQ